MRGLEVFLVFTRPLEAAGLDYLVTGSVASILYGQPRLTHDIDLVLSMARSDARVLASAFPDESFYCPPEDVLRVESGRTERGHFNLIHHQTGYKADVYLQGRDALHRWAMARRRAVEVAGERMWLAPPEYVILRKLEYYREGGARKHLEDIRGMLDVSGELLEREELSRWLEHLGLGQAWAEVPSE